MFLRASLRLLVRGETPPMPSQSASSKISYLSIERGTALLAPVLFSYCSRSAVAVDAALLAIFAIITYGNNFFDFFEALDVLYCFGS